MPLLEENNTKLSMKQYASFGLRYVFSCHNQLVCLMKFKLCCTGMGPESKDFAGELYEALARRRKICTKNGITLNEARVFWEDMTSKDLESRLQVFFDM